MADEPAPYFSGLGLAAELLVRQVLIEGLYELAGDQTALRELVRRVDTLALGSQDQWADDLVQSFVALLSPGAPDELHYKMGIPFELAELPCVSIIKEASSEDTSGAVAGDLLDLRFAQVGTYQYTPQAPGLDGVAHPVTVPALESRSLVGTAWTTTIQIGTWTTSMELSLLLDSAINHVLFKDKGRLQLAGVTDVAISEGGVPTDESQQVSLRCGYVPLQRVTLDWIRAQTVRAPAPNRIRILPPTFTS